MKIAVYGATGHAGRRIVAEAAAPRSRGRPRSAVTSRRELPDGASWQAR